jgi:hypothetical protein
VNILKILLSDERFDSSYWHKEILEKTCYNNYFDILEILLSDDRINPNGEYTKLSEECMFQKFIDDSIITGNISHLKTILRGCIEKNNIPTIKDLLQISTVDMKDVVLKEFWRTCSDTSCFEVFEILFNFIKSTSRFIEAQSIDFSAIPHDERIFLTLKKALLYFMECFVTKKICFLLTHAKNYITSNLIQKLLKYSIINCQIEVLNMVLSEHTITSLMIREYFSSFGTNIKDNIYSLICNYVLTKLEANSDVIKRILVENEGICSFILGGKNFEMILGLIDYQHKPLDELMYNFCRQSSFNGCLSGVQAYIRSNVDITKDICQHILYACGRNYLEI